MRKGEKGILAVIGISIVSLAAFHYIRDMDQKPDRGIPFYSTASEEFSGEATKLIKREHCRDCHSLWTLKDILQSVPAPMLDGIGALHDEEWFYRYFSAKNPQAILPSRLKPQYQMPSYAQLPEHDRRMLARYMASLKVKDWYLDNVKKAEHKALTGEN
jgi:sulfur-oxidizing protein SoxX